MSSFDVVVIGAGIVGVSAALALRDAGQRVLLIDRKGICAETSAGNAGAFAFSEIEPLAAPGIMQKAPRWLLDPLGPLSVRPTYLPALLPWMYRFWRASHKKTYLETIRAQAELMRLCKDAFERQLNRLQAEHLIRREGQLQLYDSQRSFDAAGHVWGRRKESGIDFELLRSAAAIAEIQPGISPRFTHAGYTPGWFNCTDPAIWTKNVGQAFQDAGGCIEIAEVRGIQPIDDQVEVTTNQGKWQAKNCVISAGAWSHHLAKQLGDHMPLETERGYNTTYAYTTFDLKTHVTFADHGFVASRIGNGIRIGGAVELAGLKAPANYRRSEILVEKARRFIPGIDLNDGVQWMGYRPSLPDSRPVISRSSRAHQVVYAFGHAHLGLTQSAGTAELVRDLVLDRSGAIDLTPFSSDRF